MLENAGYNVAKVFLEKLNDHYKSSLKSILPDRGSDELFGRLESFLVDVDLQLSKVKFSTRILDLKQFKEAPTGELVWVESFSSVESGVYEIATSMPFGNFLRNIASESQVLYPLDTLRGGYGTKYLCLEPIKAGESLDLQEIEDVVCSECPEYNKEKKCCINKEPCRKYQLYLELYLRVDQNS